MSVTITSYQDWYEKGLSVALPPWYGGKNGLANGRGTGQLLDGVLDILKNGIKARMPSLGPTDALAHIGADRQLLQGSSEPEASFRTRLKDAWSIWSRAGTACSVLENLFFYGLTGAIFVQQNGLYDKFGSDPIAGQDPTSLLVTDKLSTLGSVLTSSVTPPTNTSAGLSIPAGNPWWTFDSDVALCNRFAVIVPSWPFAALGVAVFSNSDSATVTFPFSFASGAYNVVIGPPTDNVILDADAASATGSGITLHASAPWSGIAYVLAFETGVSPLNFFTDASVGALKTLINTFRSNAVCVGLYALQSGTQFFGWPIRTFGVGGTFAPSSVSTILGSF